MNLNLRRPALIGAAVAVSVLGLAAAAYSLGWGIGGTATAPPVTISGTLTLTDYDFKVAGNKCAGTGGYDDIRNGAPVVVTDASGTTIAIGELVGGMGVSSYEVGQKHDCRWSFRIENIPGGHDFYGIEVSHRGKTQIPADRVSNPVLLSLGG